MTNARVRGVRGRHRLRHRRRAAARPGRLPGRAARRTSCPARSCSRRTRGPGRPAPPVNQWWTWTPGASLAPPRGPGLGARRARASIRSSTSPTRTPRLRRLGGPGAADRGRVGARRARRPRRRQPTSGATSPRRPASGCANYWHGDFPWRAEPGYGTTTPVGSFPPNGYGLVRHGRQRVGVDGGLVRGAARRRRLLRPAATRAAARPRRASTRPSRSSRSRAGSSRAARFLCADSYCLRYRPAARRPQMVDTGMSHVGFRCVVRPA